MEGARTLEESPRASPPRIVSFRHSGIYWAYEELPYPPRFQGTMHLRPASMPWWPPNQEGYSQGLAPVLPSQVPLEPGQLGPGGILLPD